MKRVYSIGLAVVLVGAIVAGWPLVRAAGRSLAHLGKIKATYPAATITESVQKLCAKDYGLSVNARYEGDTLQIFFWRVGLLAADKSNMQPQAARSLENVLLCATRVVLSTDARLRFLEVKMADVLTGASVTLWRYVPDIKSSMYDTMGQEEYLNRLVLEVNPEGEAALDGRPTRWDKPLSLPEFLAKQVVLRAKRQSAVALQAHEDLSRPSTLVVVIDNWPAILDEGDVESAKVTDLMQKTANSVIKGYRFNGFHGVVLQDPRGAALRSWRL